MPLLGQPLVVRATHYMVHGYGLYMATRHTPRMVITNTLMLVCSTATIGARPQRSIGYYRRYYGN